MLYLHSLRIVYVEVVSEDGRQVLGYIKGYRWSGSKTDFYVTEVVVRLR